VENKMNEDGSKPFFDVTTSENMVIGHIDGAEIFRLTFNPQNFIENFFKSMLSSPPDDLKAWVRSILEQRNIKRSEEEISAETDSVALKIINVIHREKNMHIAEQISENIDRLLIAIMEDAIKAYALESTIELNRQAGKTPPTGQLKEMILKAHWSRIADLAGIKRGGPRKRKGFVWTDEKKVAFYEKVEALPMYRDKPVWQFVLDELIEQEFDAEAITSIKNSPALKGVSEELIDTAIKTWRKYLADENWNEMDPEHKPRAFEFRHALHLLDYPDTFAYSTLETYYYEGKKLSKK
jgi:hypothetical protein